jgi:hypothetical protein
MVGNRYLDSYCVSNLGGYIHTPRYVLILSSQSMMKHVYAVLVPERLGTWAIASLASHSVDLASHLLQLHSLIPKFNDNYQ